MGNDMGFTVNPNTPEHHLPPHPPPQPKMEDDVFISYGGETTFYLDTNTVEDERLEQFAENLDAIVPQYYLLEL